MEQLCQAWSSYWFGLMVSILHLTVMSSHRVSALIVEKYANFSAITLQTGRERFHLRFGHEPTHACTLKEASAKLLGPWPAFYRCVQCSLAHFPGTRCLPLAAPAQIYTNIDVRRASNPLSKGQPSAKPVSLKMPLQEALQVYRPSCTVIAPTGTHQYTRLHTTLSR